MVNMEDQKKICVGVSEDFIEGKGKKVYVGFVECCVFRYQGELGCIVNKCVHKGGQLSEGWMRGCKAVCPWHYWEFDFKTGQGFGKESQGGYTIWEEEGKVYVDGSTLSNQRREYPAF